MKARHLVVIALLGLASCALPKGAAGPDADKLAHTMMQAYCDSCWQQTGAVTWQFGAHTHLWDRTRNLDRVSWDDYVAYVDIGTQQGRVFKNGVELQGEEKDKLVKKAWGWWANDSFWLNPLAKLFDDGTIRKLVPENKKGNRRLTITYTTGGNTPGDSYLWILGDDGLPIAWRLWVKIVPIKGAKATWQDWQTTQTGAKIALTHKALSLNIRIKDLATAHTLAELVPGDDPFAVMQ